MINHDEAVTAIYAEELARHPRGVKFAEACALIESKVRDLLANAPRNLDAEVELAMIGLARERRSRSRSLKAQIDWIADAFVNCDAAAFIDPMLNLPYPIGTDDGLDKTLRYWTPEDLQRTVTTRYRKAADAMAAVKAFDISASALVAHMHSAKAEMIDDLNRAIAPS